MSVARAADGSTDGIPVIDIGPLRDGSDPEGVAAEILDASQSVGFLYVSNHGIAEDLIRSARAAGLAFFRQPQEAKLEVEIGGAHRGFLKIGASKMDEEAQPDLKESFIWGYEPSAEAPENAFRGPNRWPAAPAGMKDAALAYFDAAHSVARLLLRAAGLGLGLAPDTFLAGSGAPLSRGSFTYYPPQAQEPSGEQAGDRAVAQFGVAPHTDFGVLTVLCQDDVGGLQVQGYDGRWIPAHPIDGTLVINVGDLLARWSNDRFRSTPHRVINRSGRERLSLVVAYDPDYDTLIDPAASYPGACESRYPPITCSDYLAWRFGRSFAYRNQDAAAG